MNDILRQAQVMQAKIAKLQTDMADRTVDSSAGGGMVKVQMNGKQELKTIQIDPQVLTDPEMLQDLIISAVNEAVRITKADLEREMATLTGGIHLPGMF